ncbi:6,7-dimethyl-8-ribityllumazine synthase [Flavihumibacter rivuli]|uniref:6,7-dimethyl-8-ribityllumazine synthase n=1 Tax=Flavihumibacter rivuli TaxID=2838156 RepID=UPI001BDE2043|nr:6,7-dimethyl-8-ribityllumazine synthase [Flavihumibacter rivuli]ULQ57626.1 6,7-dimethyl-8-ribityllumazine synthase [Flavihumibacter rivuli]
MAQVSNSNLLKLDTGILPKDACIVLVKTEWNAAVVDELEAGAIRVLEANGISRFSTITVPGAVEIPFGIKSYWEAKKYWDDRPHAFIALGCVVRGDTPHFDYVCKAVTDGVVQLNLNLPVPVIFGVLTVNNDEQARERIGGKHGHKGEEAAITALKMISLQRSFKK